MFALLARIWKALRGPLQWRILWLAHDKFILGICGIVRNNDGHVLLLRHRFWKEGSWGLPSGYAERGERIEETLAREVNEETGYEVSDVSLLKMVSGYKLRLEIVLVGRISGGQMNLDEGEVLEARFFSLENLPTGLLESHRRFIDEAMNLGRL